MPDKICGTCLHWYDQGGDPNALGDPHKGQCREGPPDATSLPMPMQGPDGRQTMMILSNYRSLPATFPACDRHAQRPAA